MQALKIFFFLQKHIMKVKKPTCAVVIVTHNSELHIGKAIECLHSQTHLPNKILIVDSGSTDRSYLLPYASMQNLEVVFLNDR